MAAKLYDCLAGIVVIMETPVVHRVPLSLSVILPDHNESSFTYTLPVQSGIFIVLLQSHSDYAFPGFPFSACQFLYCDQVYF